MPKICSFLSLENHVTLPGKWACSWFDSSRQQMILFQDKTFYLWSPFGHDNRPIKLLSGTSFPDEILFAKVSMDSKLLSVLPGGRKSVSVYDLTTKKKWNITIKNIAGNQILPGGLIWSEHGGNSQDLAVVTSKGIELHKVSSARGQCKLSRSIMQTTHLFCYEPNFRAVLLGCIIRDGTIEITGFFLRYDLSDAPRLELPPPDKMPVFRLEKGARANDLKLIVLYGVLYLSVHYCGENECTDTLALYDLSRGQSRITQTCSYPLYMSSDVDISVTDNILCCHCLQNQLTFLLDVRQCHDSKIPTSGGHMSFGACTLVVDDADLPVSVIQEQEEQEQGWVVESSIATIPIAITTTNITSPVKQLLQGEGERSGSPVKHVASHVMGALSLDEDENQSGGGNDSTSNTAKESFDALFIDSMFGSNSRSSIKFEKDNNLYVSPQRQQQQQQQCTQASPHRHVQEPYTHEWQFLTPNWVWDPHNCRLWKMKCNFSAVVSTVQSAEQIVHFLSARGLPIDAPRPVFQSDSEEDGTDAKALLFFVVFRGIVEKQSNTWFYYLFTEFAKNYAVEYHKAEPSFAAEPNGTNGLLQRNSDMTDISFEERPPPPPRGQLRAASSAPSRSSFGGHTSGQHAAGNGGHDKVLPPGRRLLHLARQAQARRASIASTRHGNGPNSRHSLGGVGVGGDLDAGHWDDTRVGGMRGPFLPDVTDDLLEPIGLASNLPEISSIGQRSFHRKPSSSGGGAERRPSYLSVASNNSSELQYLQSIRRNIESGMIITQNEMLNHIWLPLSLEYTRSHGAKTSENVDFIISALKVYISSLKTVVVAVNASISLLLLNLLAFREKYKELAHIIQLQFFSPSPEFAVALLDMADTMLDACHSKYGQHEDGKECDFQSQQRHQLQYAIATLQQAGKDILWRGQEHGTWFTGC